MFFDTPGPRWAMCRAREGLHEAPESPTTVPASAGTTASESAAILDALQVITEILSDLLQVQVDSLRLLQSSHYERDSA